MLAYYLTWHLRAAWAPLLFNDEQPPDQPPTRSPRPPARPPPNARPRPSAPPPASPATATRSLLAELATHTRNTIRLARHRRDLRQAHPTHPAASPRARARRQRAASPRSHHPDTPHRPQTQATSQIPSLTRRNFGLVADVEVGEQRRVTPIATRRRAGELDHVLAPPRPRPACAHTTRGCRAAGRRSRRRRAGSRRRPPRPLPPERRVHAASRPTASLEQLRVVGGEEVELPLDELVEAAACRRNLTRAPRRASRCSVRGPVPVRSRAGPRSTGARLGQRLAVAQELPREPSSAPSTSPGGTTRPAPKAPTISPRPPTSYTTAGTPAPIACRSAPDWSSSAL